MEHLYRYQQLKSSRKTKRIGIRINVLKQMFLLLQITSSQEHIFRNLNQNIALELHTTRIMTGNNVFPNGNQKEKKLILFIK